MCEVAFVILHYETVDDTKECVDSLVKYFDGDRVQAVIVDNGSVNGKLKPLESIYSAYKQIHFIYSERNLGFANGNNLGFVYAKKQLGAKIIILANNDLVFRQESFANELIRLSKSEKFDVAGPRIMSLVDGKNQNPAGRIYHNIGDVNKRILKFRTLRVLSYLNLDLVFRKLYGGADGEYTYDPNEDFQLHGACMFFANKYVRNYDGLYDGTFMYGEESILKYITERDNLKMCYFDSLEVFHKASSSTEKMWGNGSKKRRFFYSWNIKSCILLKKLMEKK